MPSMRAVREEEERKRREQGFPGTPGFEGGAPGSSIPLGIPDRTPWSPLPGTLPYSQRPVSPLYEPIEKAGGIVPYTASLVSNVPRDVGEIFHGVSAAGAAVKNLAWTIVSGGYFGVRGTQRAAEDLGKAGKLLPEIALSLLKDLQDLVTNPLERFRVKPVTTLIDLSAISSLAGGGLKIVGKTWNKSARGTGSAATRGLGLVRAGEIVQEIDPLRLTARGVGAVARGGVELTKRVAPPLRLAAVKHAINREVVDIVYRNPRPIVRSLETGAARDAMLVLGDLSPAEAISLIDRLQGAVTPLSTPPNVAKALQYWRDLEKPSQDFILALNLMTKEELLRVPWKPLESATRMSKEDILNRLGLMPDEVADASLRTRAGGVTRPEAVSRIVETEALESLSGAVESGLIQEVWVKDRKVLIEPPETLIFIDPIYVPLITKAQIEGSGLGSYLNRFIPENITAEQRIMEELAERELTAQQKIASRSRRQQRKAARGKPTLEQELQDLKTRGDLTETDKAYRVAALEEEIAAKSSAQVADETTKLESAFREEFDLSQELAIRRPNIPVGEVNPRTGGISPTGKLTKPSFLRERATGYTQYSRERVSDPSLFTEYHLREQARLAVQLNVIENLRREFGYRIMKFTTPEGIKKVLLTPPGPSRAASRTFGSMEELEAFLSKGLEFDGVRLTTGNGSKPHVLMNPEFMRSEAVMTNEMLGNIRAQVRLGKPIPNAISDSIKAMDPAVIADHVKALDEGAIYIFPRQVAEKIKGISNMEATMRGSGFIGIADTARAFYTKAWLSTPAFAINNLVGNVFVSLLSGVGPVEFMQAALKKYHGLIPPEIKMSQVAEEFRNPRISTRATKDAVKNAINLVRQDEVLKAFDVVGKRIGNPFTRFSIETDNYFRHTRFIKETKNLTRDMTSRERLARLSKVIDTSIPSGLTDAERLEHLVRIKQVGIDLALGDDLVGRIQLVMGEPELFEQAVKSVNHWFFDYAALAPWERHIVRRFLDPFWTWTKNITRLTAQLPFQHPARTAFMAHLSYVANDLTDQEKMPEWLKGSVESSTLEGQAVSGAGANPFQRPESILKLLQGKKGGSIGSTTPITGLVIMALGFTPSYGVPRSEETIPLSGKVYKVDESNPNIIVEEIDPNVPGLYGIPNYFLNQIPQAKVAVEQARNLFLSLPDSEITEWARSVVPKRKQGYGTIYGFQEAQDPNRELLRFMGISTAPMPPGDNEARTQLLIQKVLRRREMLRNQEEE